MELRHNKDENNYKMVEKTDTKNSTWTFELTDEGIHVPIPNLFETFFKQYHRVITKKNVDMWGCTPIATLNNKKYVCDIETGEWWERGEASVDIDIPIIYNILSVRTMRANQLHKQNKALALRVQQLETWFDHIRQKSSMIDEWIKTADEVLAEGVTVKGKPCLM